jgi:hypothetical protein
MLNAEDATWEEYDHVKGQFDLSKLEGKLKKMGKAMSAHNLIRLVTIGTDSNLDLNEGNSGAQKMGRDCITFIFLLRK